MYKFTEYKGEIIDQLPFDVGNPIFELNWTMSSSTLNQYVYQNDKGDLFHVEGVLQHTASMMESYQDDTQYYHLALVTPIKDSKSLKNYLIGDGPIKILFDEKGDSFLMKLDAYIFVDDNGNKNATMHHVENGEETSRRTEKNVSEFNLLELKKCNTKKLPDLISPFVYKEGIYEHRAELSWIFNSDEDKDAIDEFIKNN